LAFVFLFSCCFSLAQTQQPEEKQVQVSDGVSLTFPPVWGVTRQTPHTVEIDYPVPSGETKLNSEQLVAPSAQIMAFVEQRSGHKEALSRLVEIASETPANARAQTLAGWPSIFKTYELPLPKSGEADQESTKVTGARFAVTVVAVDKRVIHITVLLVPGADTKLFTDAIGIVSHIQISKKEDRNMLRADLRDLGAALENTSKKLSADMKRQSVNSSRYAIVPSARPPLTAAQVMTRSEQQYSYVQDGEGELEVAVSNDGRNVVVAANSGVSFSHDAGQTFHKASIPEPSDDPSVTVGKSGNFYYSWIGKSRNVDSISVSVDLGEHFRFLSNAVVLPEHCAMGDSCLPDQPHIAADRSEYSSSGGDQVYLVWRDMSGNLKSPKISCSTDGGQTWPTVKTIYTASDIFPRLSVGSDGAVFVIFATSQEILLNKYSSCDSGLQLMEEFPVTVTSFVNVSCPVPGLDRCNSGNILSSPTVSQDDLDPKHIYVAWATATVAGENEDVMLADSLDGGRTFPRFLRLNAPVRARRFMPWLVTDRGVAYVNWYDRRYSNAAGAASNDLTRYMSASASVSGGSLVAGKEVDLSHIDDPQCSNLWPRAPRSEQDALSCSAPAQSAGRCHGTDTPCDFNIGCSGGRQCLTGRGLPKYGDYNGVAATAGKLYSFWASIQPPDGVTVSAGDSNSSVDSKRLHIFGLIESLPR
jgi:hypothetical protein